MINHEEEYIDALVDLEAEEIALFHLLEIYARSPQEWFSERLRASIEQRLDIYVNALIYVNDHTDYGTRATDEWQAETERRNLFAAQGISPALEVLDVLTARRDDRNAESPAAQYVAQIIRESAELSRLTAHAQGDDAARRSLIRRHRAVTERALGTTQALPLPLVGDAEDGFAKCPLVAELRERVVAAGEAALDVLSPDWRDPTPNEEATDE